MAIIKVAFVISKSCGWVRRGGITRGDDVPFGRFAKTMFLTMAVWDGMERYGAVWDGMGRYGTIWGGMGQYWTVRDNMGRYGTVWDVPYILVRRSCERSRAIPNDLPIGLCIALGRCWREKLRTEPRNPERFANRVVHCFGVVLAGEATDGAERTHDLCDWFRLIWHRNASV